jgi:predicted RND superfamily exporter protein
VTALLGRLYDAVVLRRPLAVIGALALLCGLAATQLPKLRIDASADSLMLRGDPALEFFREVGKRYSAEDFLLLTWQPDAPLLSDESLLPLRAMADELRALPGVASVVTVWDVPLLESPPVSLSDISSPQPLPSLSEAGIDRELALREFTSSPIYADLLVGRSGDVTAVQVNLTRDDRYFELLERRESLRGQAGTLDAAGRAALEAAEAAFKAYSAIALQHQSEMVDEVRAIADRYREHARIFVGGVPMIAADMVSFVRSDLVVFGAAIVGIMMLILAVIFRRVRWVVIPLVTCAVSVTLLLGLLAALDWRMTVISSNSVAVLLIVTMSIAIHLVVRYRELHAEDRDGDLRRRVRETVRSMVVPCFYTAATTMVAFVSLVVSGLQPVIDFGWMMAVGISIALGVAFLLVPALMLAWPTGRPLRGARAHAHDDPAFCPHHRSSRRPGARGQRSGLRTDCHRCRAPGGREPVYRLLQEEHGDLPGHGAPRPAARGHDSPRHRRSARRMRRRRCPGWKRVRPRRRRRWPRTIPLRRTPEISPRRGRGTPWALPRIPLSMTGVPTRSRVMPLAPARTASSPASGSASRACA